MENKKKILPKVVVGTVPVVVGGVEVEAVVPVVEVVPVVVLPVVTM